MPNWTNIGTGIGQGAGSVLGSLVPVRSKTASSIGSAVMGAAPFTGPAAPFVAIAGVLISPLASWAMGVQAPEMGPKEIKKNFCTEITAEAYRNFYLNIGLSDSGDRSAYNFTNHLVLAPAMIWYCYSINGERYLDCLKNNKSYNYGQDWEIPFRKYLNTGDPTEINNLWNSIFARFFPSGCDMSVPLIPVPVEAQAANAIAEAGKNIKPMYLLIGIGILFLLMKD